MEDRSSPFAHKPLSLSLVIPAYNEALGIRQAIREADEALTALGCEYELLVVDDGSRDQMAEAVLEEAASRPAVRLLRHERNQGYGAALRTGFEAARHERVAFTDADCQFHLADLASLLTLTEDHEIAVGFRMARKDPLRRRFISWGYNTLIRTLLGTQVRDVDCALKVFRKEAVQKLLPETNGFFVNTEMLSRAQQQGYRVAEAGVRHRPRARGESKVSLRDIPRTLKALLPFWWTRVLFAGRAPRAYPLGHEGQSPSSHRLLTPATFIALSFMALLLCFSGMGLPLQEPEESRYAEIPRQMLESGNWIVPTLNGQVYADKPPLLYWLVMASYRLFGVHDWAARLVSCTCAFLTILLTYFWGSRVLSHRAGLAAALVLCFSPRFIYLERLLTMNSLLCLCIVAAWAAAHFALDGRRLVPGWWVLSALACGLGLLAKGPVALVLVLTPVVLFSMLDTRTARVSVRAWAGFLLIALGLALPWCASVNREVPGFLTTLLWKHNVVRFMAPFDHSKPEWYYLPDLFLALLPSALLLPALIRWVARRQRQENALPPAFGYILLALSWGLLFFSLAGSKRAGYILPLLPLVALALGGYIDHALRRLQVPALHPGLRQRLASYWTVGTAAAFLLMLATVHTAFPHLAQTNSMRSQVRDHLAEAVDKSVPVICYPRGWDSVSFYLGRSDVRVYRREQRAQLIADLQANPRTLAFIKSDESLPELLRALPVSLEFAKRGKQGQVAVGWLQPRWEAPVALYAEHGVP